MKKLGLVLAGGGKGAYHVGVWKALETMPKKVGCIVRLHANGGMMERL